MSAAAVSPSCSPCSRLAPPRRRGAGHAAATVRAAAAVRSRRRRRRPPADDDSRAGRSAAAATLLLIGGALLVAFVAIGLCISRDARRSLPGPRRRRGRLREEGPHSTGARPRRRRAPRGKAQKAARRQKPLSGCGASIPCRRMPSSIARVDRLDHLHAREALALGLDERPRRELGARALDHVLDRLRRTRGRFSRLRQSSSVSFQL